jgi:SecD/SecF fusion protein
VGKDMSDLVKKLLAILVILVIIVGGVLTMNGFGSIDPLKDQIKLGLDIEGGVYVVMEAQTDLTGDELTQLMDQTKAVIEKRVDQMGLVNPIVTIEGQKRIRVELPGAKDAEEAIAQIGKTAQLKFTLADGGFVLDGGSVKNAVTQQDTQKGGYAVGLEFDSEGAKAFEAATIKALSGTVVPSVTENGVLVDSRSIVISLDGKVISAPTVEEVISGGECQITGRYTQEEATNLAALIRGGALPVELQEVTSSVQTATVGLNALEMSIYAGAIGFLIIFLIMFFGYRLMGLAANIALCLYVLLILVTMVLFGSVLTLPGIAGIIVSIGMTVDANIIIFSRIKEEITGGKSIRVAMHTGFKRAMSTIVDSQITTFLAAIILYQVGTSAVKGFALTLMIGIFASVFTAVIVTQLLLALLADSPKFSKLKYFGMHEDGTPMFKIKRQFNIIKHRKIYYIVSVALITIGLLVGGIRGFNYGIDFTGGTMMNIDMGKQVASSEIKDVFSEYDVDTNQMQIVYSGENLETVIIKTRDAIDNSVRTQIIDDFQEQFGIAEEDVLGIELFGPAVGKELQANALKAILFSVIGMLLYIRFRFREWKFGAAAILADMHDILLVVAFYAIFQITVNNPFIAGILTVLGYSINDTIVVFDRVRENLRLMKKETTAEILDTSINQTLTRSIMTSTTTVVVMIPLFVLSGPSIREFVMPLMVGVIVGTMSSIFVSSPLYHDFASMKKKSGYRKHVEKNKKKSNYFAAPGKKPLQLLAEEDNKEKAFEQETYVVNERPTIQTSLDDAEQTGGREGKSGPVKTNKHSKKGKKNRR